MSNIYSKVTIRKTDVLNFWFAKFKEFVSWSVFGELQLSQISLNFKTLLQLKNQRSESKTVCGFFIILILKGIIKSKSPCILLNKNINFNKNKTESKMENPTHSLREANLVLQLIQKLQIESRVLIRWSSRKKKEGMFCTAYFVRRKLF